MLNAKKIPDVLFLNDRHCMLIHIWNTEDLQLSSKTVAIMTVQHIECEGPLSTMEGGQIDLQQYVKGGTTDSNPNEKNN